MASKLDCVVIGYNELPFDRYESFLRNYGENTEAYRDLKFSFVDLGKRKLDYVGLMNHVNALAHKGNGFVPDEAYKSGDIPNLAAAYLTDFLRSKGLQTQYINLFQYEKQRLIDFLAEDPLCRGDHHDFLRRQPAGDEIVEFIRRAQQQG